MQVNFRIIKDYGRVSVPGTALEISKKLEGLTIIMFTLYKLLFQPQVLHKLNFGSNVIDLVALIVSGTGRVCLIYYH
jgi:hypothetical protein